MILSLAGRDVPFEPGDQHQTRLPLPAGRECRVILRCGRLQLGVQVIGDGEHIAPVGDSAINELVDRVRAVGKLRVHVCFGFEPDALASPRDLMLESRRGAALY